MIDEKMLMPLWDNGLQKLWDWELEWSPESLLDRIRKLPKVNLKPKNVSQMRLHWRWWTGCTWVSWMNLLWTIGWEDLTDKIMEEAEQMAIADWRKNGSGWYRGAWTNVARKMWNKYYPDREVQTYLVWLDSPEAKAYLETGRPVHTSVNVNTAFWNQAYKGLVDKYNFSTWVWHATTHREWKIWKEFLDSWNIGEALKNDKKEWHSYEVIMEVFDKMPDRPQTLRTDVHIVLPTNIVPMITKDVPGWQWYSDSIKWLIENDLTTEKEYFKPQDKMTRAEMAVFMKRFYDKFIKKD